ncbi:hypothetical protein E4M02_02605 [Brevundimonas sp. S30B]|uniref:hypothetical protein n=1 Tax=unclassified Brevundimonas TaxID=2622653 RepID=UPI00107227B9|nr:MULTISPECIES: hypothetical protein [unclassified Brevundimonas]QBX37219.1 hypothetical protein E4M01_05215 [Brevundimonas sp. MF30-B]TFW03987.1 hypothetical protein E4M02_02605 [Brevundimonas sp. S30B]
MKSLLIAAGLMAFVAPQQTVPGPGTAQLAAARAALDERLLDYPSARFREVRGNNMVLCGNVNAKNRMGAYSGWTRFAVFHSDGSSSVYMDGEGSGTIMVDGFCGSGVFDGRDYTDQLRHR